MQKADGLKTQGVIVKSIFFDVIGKERNKPCSIAMIVVAFIVYEYFLLNIKVDYIQWDQRWIATGR